MANEEHLNLLQQGTKHWNSWREAHPDIQIDLSGAEFTRGDLSRDDPIGADLCTTSLYRVNFSGADLRWANFSGADLHESNFSKANLSNGFLFASDLSYADLSYTDLSGVDLSHASFFATNLSRATFNGADLYRTDFNGSDLSGANFSGAITRQTIFDDLDLRVVEGLETIQHDGPSSITTSTLERSEGDIPKTFLRGVGLSDTFIKNAHSLVQSPIQFYSCFISYSSKDQNFAEHLYADLQST